MNRWPAVRLDSCTDIISGATPSTSEPSYWNGNICWVTPKDLSELDGAYISDTPRKITPAGLASCSADVLPPHSVLFSSRAPIGHVAINTVPMATNQGFKSFVPHPDKLDAKFLYHWLRTNRVRLERLGNGVTFKEVSKAVVSGIEVPLPPISDQRRIAEILDKADALRVKRRTGLAQLDTLTQSIFLDMFGDPGVNPKNFSATDLSSLTQEDDGINYGVVQPGEDVGDGVPLIRVSDLVGGIIEHSGLKRISPVIEAAYKRSRLRGDEILVSCVGTIGIVATADETVRGFNIARAVARIPLSDSVDRIFMASYLRTSAVQRYFRNELRTVSQPTLNIKQLAETKILLPPLELQREYARRVRATEAVKAAGRTALMQCDTLFSSLQQHAFAGQL